LRFLSIYYNYGRISKNIYIFRNVKSRAFPFGSRYFAIIILGKNPLKTSLKKKFNFVKVIEEEFDIFFGFVITEDQETLFKLRFIYEIIVVSIKSRKNIRESVKFS